MDKSIMNRLKKLEAFQLSGPCSIEQLSDADLYRKMFVHYSETCLHEPDESDFLTARGAEGFFVDRELLRNGRAYNPEAWAVIDEICTTLEQTLPPTLIDAIQECIKTSTFVKLSNRQHELITWLTPEERTML
jgi:hypothetical protein